MKRDSIINIYNENCQDFLRTIDTTDMIMVTDPPFNIGYHYNKYKDRMKEEAYLDFMKEICDHFDMFVIIHYPEALHKISIRLGIAPSRVVEWVYNSNTRRQHRSIAFYGFEPDFSQVKQPYKNPNDKRIKKLIENGSKGTNIYDWWNINQVKNVSREKTEHPCQMPTEVMDNIIGVIPKMFSTCTIVDPFMGSGTTGVSAKKHNYDFIGIEMDETYFKISDQRINSFSWMGGHYENS